MKFERKPNRVIVLIGRKMGRAKEFELESVNMEINPNNKTKSKF